MIRFALLAALSTAACSSTETTPSATDSSVSDARADDAVSETARDTAVDEAAGDDAGQCCPIGERGCCMLFGGSRAKNPSCGMVCDSIPTDLEVRTDDAGCPYWHDPPGGGVTCTFEPPDTGRTD